MELASSSSSNRALGAFLQHDAGEELTVFVAVDRWWLLWTPADYADHGTGSFHSVQSANSLPLPQAEDLIACYLFGHHGELDMREAVDASAAIATITEFFSSAGRPERVVWMPD